MLYPAMANRKIRYVGLRYTKVGHREGLRSVARVEPLDQQIDAELPGIPELLCNREFRIISNRTGSKMSRFSYSTGFQSADHLIAEGLGCHITLTLCIGK